MHASLCLCLCLLFVFFLSLFIYLFLHVLLLHLLLLLQVDGSPQEAPEAEAAACGVCTPQRAAANRHGALLQPRQQLSRCAAATATAAATAAAAAVAAARCREGLHGDWRIIL